MQDLLVAMRGLLMLENLTPELWMRVLMLGAQMPDRVRLIQVSMLDQRWMLAVTPQARTLEMAVRNPNYSEVLRPSLVTKRCT
jgi:hypothetical protein